MADGENQTPAPDRWSFLRRHRELLAAGVILLVALLPITADVAGPDGGDISVHGPQIYTRERLVNDRYQEDSWLNTVLDDSLKIQFGATEARQTSKTTNMGLALKIGDGAPDPGKPGDPAKAGEGGGAAPGAGMGGALPDVRPPPTFELEARRAYRERIRSMIIENQLDDRHDLHGNTLYRLHFDATILPTEHSRSAARIEIFFNRPNDMKALPEPLRDLSLDAVLPLLQSWEHLYARWLNSVEARLDDSANDKARRFETGKFGPDEYDTLIVRLRSAVLSMAAEIEAPLPPNAGLCIRDKREAALQKLAQLRDADSFPVPNKPDFVEDTGMQVEAFRDAYLRGVALAGTPVEESLVHRTYGDRIRSLLMLRRTLSELTSTAECPLTGPVAVSADPGAMLPPLPKPRPPSEITTTQELRQLIYSEFWPQIYNAVTGVDDVETTGSDATATIDPSAVQFAGLAALALDMAPPSLRPYAGVTWRPRELRRPFQVTERTVTLTVTTDAKCLPAVGQGVVAQPAVGNRELLIPNDAALRFVSENAAELMPLVLAKADVDLGQRLQQLATKPPPDREQSEGERCYLASTSIAVPVGLFNFVRRLGKATTIYTYAVNPTEPDELIGNRARSELVREFDTGLALKALTQAMPSGDVAGALKDKMVGDLRRDAVRRTVFGYGKDGTMESGGGMLGWQVMPRDESAETEAGRRYLGPKQIPMTALISLPAWWEKVQFVVKRSWVDRQGREMQIQERSGERASFTIELPTNFETLDALLFETADTGPVITDWQIPRLAVRPCYPFSVTIIGRRLWRSTVVTLGSERASKVIVVPNMNGIIAEFRKIPMPTNATPGVPYVAPLTVWTSQGYAPLPKLIEVTIPDKTTAAANLTCPAGPADR